MNTLQEDLIAQAAKWTGVRETGANKGPEVEMFQKAVDGKARGESWCMAFVQFCLQQVEALHNVRTNVFSSEHCLTVWNNTPFVLRAVRPSPGSIVIWQHGTSSNGHTGIVTLVDDSRDTFTTIEGNTSSGAGVVRDGDGVYVRTRSLHPTGGMHIVGFINPFEVEA